MRHTALALLLALPTAASAADVTVDLSGRLLDATGQTVPDGPHTLEVRFFDAPTAGTAAWSGQLTVETVGGYFAAEVGAGTPHLDSDDLAGDRWLELVVDPPSEPLAPRQRLSAVPRAATADLALAVQTTTVAPTCDADHIGSLYYDDSRFSLRVCATVGSSPTWLDLATAAISVKNHGAYRAWTDGSVATSCDDYRNPAFPFLYDGDTGSGIYRIQPASTAFDVWCDMETDGGGWTYVAESGRSKTDPTDTTISGPGSYHRYQYDLAGMAYDEALVKRPSGYYWCNSWGTNATAWTLPGTTSMGIAYNTTVYSYHNGETSPYAWIQQPYSISSSCSSCWQSNNTTPSTVAFTGLDGPTGAVVKLDPPGTDHVLLEVSNFDAFIGQAGGCSLSSGNQATWQTYVR